MCFLFAVGTALPGKAFYEMKKWTENKLANQTDLFLDSEKGVLYNNVTKFKIWKQNERRILC